jgi:hypothetical protein
MHRSVAHLDGYPAATAAIVLHLWSYCPCRVHHLSRDDGYWIPRLRMWLAPSRPRVACWQPVVASKPRVPRQTAVPMSRPDRASHSLHQCARSSTAPARHLTCSPVTRHSMLNANLAYLVVPFSISAAQNIRNAQRQRKRSHDAIHGMLCAVMCTREHMSRPSQHPSTAYQD